MTYKNKIYDEERALYGIENSCVKNCTFDGPADGESALKECSNIAVDSCNFMLRYPLWHVSDAVIKKSEMTETCRAALWYDSNVAIENCSLYGIKALRECEKISLKNCEIKSEEFGWRCNGLDVENCSLSSMYPFFECKNLCFDNLALNGKYSFQYIENATLKNCELKTKDAFWHCKNVTVEDSLIQGEYLAWYSQNLKLVRCRIVGTQPLCYCKGLILEDCTMEGADFAFENSEVVATVKSPVISIKNPLKGLIKVPSVGEVILDGKFGSLSECKIEIG